MKPLEITPHQSTSKHSRLIKSTSRVGALVALTFLAACQSPPMRSAVPSTSPDEVGELRKGTGYLNGYLKRDQYPDSLALLPAPPAEGSVQAKSDLEYHQAGKKLRATSRGDLAAKDSVLKYPAFAQTFSCALDVQMGTDATPHLNMLIRRSWIDAGLATYGAKNLYQRKRPFVVLHEGTCVPKDEAKLAKDGSYPSGHSALGWGVGLILASIAPERGKELLDRGYQFGQSRMVCGVHWQSDVDAGRLIGSATFARLQSDPVYAAQAKLAQQEIQAARAKGLKPSRTECDAEAAALSQ